jgi:hypothetical protein
MSSIVVEQRPRLYFRASPGSAREIRFPNPILTYNEANSVTLNQPLSSEEYDIAIKFLERTCGYSGVAVILGQPVIGMWVFSIHDHLGQSAFQTLGKSYFIIYLLLYRLSAGKSTASQHIKWSFILFHENVTKTYEWHCSASMLSWRKKRPGHFWIPMIMSQRHDAPSFPLSTSRNWHGSCKRHIH